MVSSYYIIVGVWCWNSSSQNMDLRYIARAICTAPVAVVNSASVDKRETTDLNFVV